MIRLKRPLVTLCISVSALVLGALPMTALASTAPGLGTATSYAILAGTPSITNTGPSVISGDVGIFPAVVITGFPPGIVVNGTFHSGAVASKAKGDLTGAYLVAASAPCDVDKTGINLGGKTLVPGTYCQTTAPTLTGVLTLSGNGVYIFQIGSTLVTAPGATVVLKNGAQACNVFWQVSSSATLDTTTTFVGTIMALTDIHLNNGAKILGGRALARNGTVTLINNQITAPTECKEITPSPSASGSPGASPTASPTASATATPTATPTATAAAVLATTGGGSREGFPWILALIAGSLGAVGLGLSVRARRLRV